MKCKTSKVSSLELLPSEYILNQLWFNVGSPSAMLAQHLPTIRSMCLCLLCKLLICPFTADPAARNHWHNVCLMSPHRLRRLPNITPALDEWHESAGGSLYWRRHIISHHSPNCVVNMVSINKYPTENNVTYILEIHVDIILCLN